MARYKGSGAYNFVLRGLMPSQTEQIHRARLLQQRLQQAQSKPVTTEPTPAPTEAVKPVTLREQRFAANRKKAIEAMDRERWAKHLDFLERRGRRENDNSLARNSEISKRMFEWLSGLSLFR